MNLGSRTGSDLLLKLHGNDTRVLLLYLQLTGCHRCDLQLRHQCSSHPSLKLTLPFCGFVLLLTRNRWKASSVGNSILSRRTCSSGRQKSSFVWFFVRTVIVFILAVQSTKLPRDLVVKVFRPFVWETAFVEGFWLGSPELAQSSVPVHRAIPTHLPATLAWVRPGVPGCVHPPGVPGAAGGPPVRGSSRAARQRDRRLGRGGGTTAPRAARSRRDIMCGGSRSHAPPAPLFWAALAARPAAAERPERTGSPRSALHPTPPPRAAAPAGRSAAGPVPGCEYGAAAGPRCGSGARVSTGPPRRNGGPRRIAQGSAGARLPRRRGKARGRPGPLAAAVGQRGAAPQRCHGGEGLLAAPVPRDLSAVCMCVAPPTPLLLCTGSGARRAVRCGPVGGAGRGVPGAPGCFVTGVWSPPRPSVPPGRRGLRGRGLGRQAGGAGVGAGPPRIGQGAGAGCCSGGAGWRWAGGRACALRLPEGAPGRETVALRMRTPATGGRAGCCCRHGGAELAGPCTAASVGLLLCTGLRPAAAGRPGSPSCSGGVKPRIRRWRSRSVLCGARFSQPGNRVRSRRALPFPAGAAAFSPASKQPGSAPVAPAFSVIPLFCWVCLGDALLPYVANRGSNKLGVCRDRTVHAGSCPGAAVWAGCSPRPGARVRAPGPSVPVLRAPRSPRGGSEGRTDVLIRFPRCYILKIPVPLGKSNLIGFYISLAVTVPFGYCTLFVCFKFTSSCLNSLEVLETRYWDASNDWGFCSVLVF